MEMSLFNRSPSSSRFAKGLTRRPHPFFSSLLKSEGRHHRQERQGDRACQRHSDVVVHGQRKRFSDSTDERQRHGEGQRGQKGHSESPADQSSGAQCAEEDEGETPVPSLASVPR